MSLKVSGWKNLQAQYDAYVATKKKEIADLRRQVAAELTERLMENIPVWSGRTIASMNWTNNGGMKPRVANPRNSRSGRGDTARFGRTSTMPLGAEPMRSEAEALARAGLDQVDYSIEKDVSLTINSTAWGLVELGRAPGDQFHKPRNKGVVSKIAIMQVKAKFGMLK